MIEETETPGQQIAYRGIYDGFAARTILAKRIDDAIRDAVAEEREACIADITKLSGHFTARAIIREIRNRATAAMKE